MAFDVKTLAEQILLIYLGGRQTTEGIDIRDIELLVKQALDGQITADYYNNYKFENQSTSNSAFLVPFELPIVAGKVSLPEKSVNLPKDRGVSGVYKGTGFLDPLTQITYDRYAAMESGGLLKFASKFYYYRLTDDLYIVGSCPTDKIPFSKVRVVMTISNDATIDEGMSLVIISQVLPLIERYRKPDMKNDQNPTVV
jgi:hypothetical protein